MALSDIVALDHHPLQDAAFQQHCGQVLTETDVLVLADFLRPAALASILAESVSKQNQAHFCTQSHSVYLTPPNPTFAADNPANRQVESSKGCICDDQIDASSPPPPAVR